MSQKTCIICGRLIKTGRKYCYLHRNAADAETFRGEKLIQEATKQYRRYKLGPFLVFCVKYAYIIVILSFVGLPGFILTSIGVDINLVFYIVIGIILIFSLFTVFAGIKLFNLNNKIKNNDKEWADFVRKYISAVKKESEFRKSLLK